MWAGPGSGSSVPSRLAEAFYSSPTLGLCGSPPALARRTGWRAWVAADGDQVVGNRRPVDRSVESVAATIAASLHPEDVLEARDPGFTSGAPRAASAKPTLPLVQDPLGQPVTRPREHRAQDAQLDDALLTVTRVEASIRGDEPRGSSEQADMMLDSLWAAKTPYVSRI
jgi:hypothetical protein